MGDELTSLTSRALRRRFRFAFAAEATAEHHSPDARCTSVSEFIHNLSDLIFIARVAICTKTVYRKSKGGGEGERMDREIAAVCEITVRGHVAAKRARNLSAVCRAEERLSEASGKEAPRLCFPLEHTPAPFPPPPNCRILEAVHAARDVFLSFVFFSFFFSFG